MSRLLLKEGSDTDTPPTGYVSLYPRTDGRIYSKDDTGAERPMVNEEEWILDVSRDETTALTTGTNKFVFRSPAAFTLTEVRASVTTAPTGGTIIVDINEGGTTILSTKLTIDVNEKTSTTAATPAVISDANIANDAEVTIDIDQVGSGTAGAGLKVYLIGAKQ